MWSEYLTYHLFTQAPAATGAFYYFSSLINPINQPSIPGTMTNNESYDICLSVFSTRYVRTSVTPPCLILGLGTAQRREQLHQMPIQT